MKGENKFYIFAITSPIILFMGIFGLGYIVVHPEVRNISYYEDDNYYMCNAITGGGESSDNWHFGAVKKEDYESWANGTSETIWIVSSTNKNKGWRLRCNMISTIQIYDKKHLPLNF